jgi:hypothetical protein
MLVPRGHRRRRSQRLRPGTHSLTESGRDLSERLLPLVDWVIANAADRQSPIGRHSPLMQHVARSRWEVVTFRARDDEVTSGIPFQVITSAA